METSVKPCSFQSVSELGGKGEEAEEEEESVSRWQRRRASHVGRSGGFSFQFRNHFVDQSGVIELETGHGAEAGLS